MMKKVQIKTKQKTTKKINKTISGKTTLSVSRITTNHQSKIVVCTQSMLPV